MSNSATMCGDMLPFSLFQFSYHMTDKPINKQCKLKVKRSRGGGRMENKVLYLHLKKQKTCTVFLNMATQDLTLFQRLYKKKKNPRTWIFDTDRSII